MEKREASPGGSDRFLGLLAYVGPLVLVPLFVRTKIRFLRFHTRQGLYLFGVFVILFGTTFGFLYLFGDAALDVALAFQTLAVLALMELAVYVIAMVVLGVRALRGEMPMLPVLGELAGES